MTRLRVSCFSISLDGYGAGPRQELQHPIGVGGLELFDWFFHTRTWRGMHGQEGGEAGIDDDFAARGMAGVGAWILGRHMFGPVRGPWPDESWRGWWGEEPPYHVPVFVLTHHARAPLAIRGGTEFRIVTEGIGAALRQAREAAGGLDVRLGGGAATIRQFLRARILLVLDEDHGRAGGAGAGAQGVDPLEDALDVEGGPLAAAQGALHDDDEEGGGHGAGRRIAGAVRATGVEARAARPPTGGSRRGLRVSRAAAA